MRAVCFWIMLVQLPSNLCLLCLLTVLLPSGHRCHEHDTPKHNRSQPHPPVAASLAGVALEEEQHFYILQLFRRYGTRDRLDFHGFQSLLLSLGLGEVKLVEVDHEELGHDHVAHLDVLDVQDGAHSHAVTQDGHGHGHGHGHDHGTEHGHGHDHGGHHKHDHGSRTQTEQAPTKCTDYTTASMGRETTRGREMTPSGDRPRSRGGHGHPHGGHGPEDAAPEEVQTQAKEMPDLEHDHHGHDPHDHEHDHHRGRGHEEGAAQNGGRVEAEEAANVQTDAMDAEDVTKDLEHHDQENHKSHDLENHKSHDSHDHDGHNHENHKGHDHENHKGHDNHKHGDHDHLEGHNHHEGHDHHKHGDHDHHEGHDHHRGGVHPEDSGHNGGTLKPEQEVDLAQTVGQVDSAVQDSTSSKPSWDLQIPDDAPLQTDAQSGSTAPPASAEQKRRKGKGHKGRGRGQTGGGVARSRREAGGGLTTPTSPALIGPPHPEGSAHQHEECLNLTQLLTDFGLSPDSLISPLQFSFLCPALLYQIDSRVCIRHYHQVEVESQALEPPSSVWVWLWGFVSITVISLLSLLGVVLVPILDQSCFKFLLTFLVALAVGTLSGDALLHLLPHAQGTHDHSDAQEQASDLGTEFDGVWKGLTALAGIYLLFIIEHCLGMYKHYKHHQSLQTDDGGIGRKLSEHKLNRRSDAEWLDLKALPEDANSSATCDNGLSDTQLTEVQTPDSALTATPPSPPPAPSPKKNGQRGHKGHGHKGHGHKGHGHSHGGNCHSDQDMKDADIASIAWMVVMGDGMHNFSDGLAIGAAFSANLTGGISTSVAVFCHELPHELGDFAVLLKAGMSVRQAIVYNVLSALMAYVGMVIGTAVGQYTHNLTSWIFAVTAGMFLYVALVDMLPEMLHGDSEDHKRCQVGHFLLQNLGMLSGFSIMLLIAIFEDRIVFDFGF